MSRQALPLSCQNHPNLIWRHFSHLLSTQHSAYGHACTLVSMGMNHNMYMYGVAFFFFADCGGRRQQWFYSGVRAACGRIWGVCAPDVGTPLCAAAWLIFITAHNDGAREWGLGWKKARRNKRAASSERQGRRAENNRGLEEGDKENSEAEKLCFLLIQ